MQETFAIFTHTHKKKIEHNVSHCHIGLLSKDPVTIKKQLSRVIVFRSGRTTSWYKMNVDGRKQSNVICSKQVIQVIQVY